MNNTTGTLRAVDLPRPCSASTLVTLLRSYAKAEREKSINSTLREPKIMHAYAANRIEAILLAVGVSKDEPNKALSETPENEPLKPSKETNK